MYIIRLVYFFFKQRKGKDYKPNYIIKGGPHVIIYIVLRKISRLNFENNNRYKYIGTNVRTSQP